MTPRKLSTLICFSGLLTACGGSDLGHDTPTPGSDPVSSSSSSLDISSSSSSSSEISSSSSSSGSTVTPENPSVRQGFFIDSVVANLRYQTESGVGYTTADGQFNYLAGEMVTFSIGDLTFPSVKAQPTITPLTLAGTDDPNNTIVINIVRLLLSLDQDSNPDNGITIDELAHGAATAALDFSLDPSAFAESSAVLNLLSASGSSSMTLVPESEAFSHFQNTLDTQVNHSVVASADGPGETYELFDEVFGGNAVESPVCDPATDSFGPRITEVMDETLEEYVFAFHLLRDVDGDRCIDSITDRQRIEVKTYSASPADRVATEGEIHTYRWKFKLDDGFQASSSFTHIFQIKAAGGDDSMPILTLTPRAGSQDQLQVLHAGSTELGATEVATADLSEFRGQWIEAFVRTKNTDNGSLEIRLSTLSDNNTLIDWSDNNIDMWREGASLNRPKWGLYRGLNNSDMLRDETIFFNDFCIAESTNICASDVSDDNHGGGNGDGDDGDSETPIKDGFGFEAEAVGQAPVEFDIEGDIIVSAEQAREGMQSAKFSHASEGQVRMRHNFGAQPTGSLKTSILIPENVGVDSLITVYAETYNSANRAIDLLFKPDGTLRRREGGSQIDLQAYNFNEWLDIELQWQDLAQSNEYTLVINNRVVGTFTATTPGLTPERVEFKFGGNSSAISNESIYVDAVTISDTVTGNQGSSSSISSAASSSSESSQSSSTVISSSSSSLNTSSSSSEASSSSSSVTSISSSSVASSSSSSSVNSTGFAVGQVNNPDFGFETDAFDAPPADFDSEGSIAVANDVAREGTQVVKLTHPVEGQVRMRREFGSNDSGTIKASLFFSPETDQDSLVTLYAEEYNSANRAIDIIFKSDGSVRRREGSEQVDIMNYDLGGWIDLEIQWDNLSTSNEYALVINGINVGTYAAATSGLTPERVEFKYGGNSSAVTTEPLYLDAISMPKPEAGGGDPEEGNTYSFEEDTLGQAPADLENDADTPSHVQVSSDLAKDGTQSVKLSHPDEGQVRLRANWGAKDTGSVSAAVYIPAANTADVLMTVYATTYNSANRSMDIILKPDGDLKRRTQSGQEDTTSYNFDAWNTIKLSWTEITTSNEYTLWVNGVNQGTFPVATPNLTPERVEFKFGGNASDTSPESVYLDSVVSFE
ncbi:hypothetical protein [Gilvimarinus xylanilyticus]|uniref:Uncharacterized protein n=1 Tax=Gilvimarinus xylanilyticus TaxID=2944139 RepID=A0A9X2HXE0_9GAMM|nr:hypothetical protein [Gilvimarinus xylanilyticus]MCP8899875.1 hypothetical protein [Gilvimarinus xylanilyticus]